ncbi:uncharacterized protein [Antedon mediterranea]|uniref:uncharacterized protein isoform X2 n=1 Tax=Antedon mediterranea TaxID=105859 RepID=UPI003AF49906
MSTTLFLYAYELQRVGSESTCPNVKDVFRLHKHKTVFGRNSEKVDFYLNSGVYKQLISRQHAELLIYQDDDCQPVFVLCDKSVNGTYVNDVKVSKMVRVKELDTITFGHVQGVSIKAGIFAKQDKSEFRFRLEKVLVTSSESPLQIVELPTFSTSPLYFNGAKTSVNRAKTCEVMTSSQYLQHTLMSKTDERKERRREESNEENSKKTISNNKTSALLRLFKEIPSPHVCKLDVDNFNNRNSKNQMHGTASQLVDNEVLEVASTAIQRAIIVMDSDDSESFSIDVGDYCHLMDNKAGKHNVSGVEDESKETADVTIKYPIQNTSLNIFEFNEENSQAVKTLGKQTHRLESLRSLENLNGNTTKTHPLQKMPPVLNEANRRKSNASTKNQHSASKKTRSGTYRNYSSKSKSEVFVPEKCASIDCCIPVDNTISWANASARKSNQPTAALCTL